MRRRITEQIAEWYHSGRKTALMISGSRQIGKTYSIEDFGNNVCPGNFLKIDFSTDSKAMAAFQSDLDVDSIIRSLSSIYRDFEFVPEKTLLFFDEIQNCPNARTALKPLAIDGRFRIIASGSLLGIRLREIGLYPMGYVEDIRMEPMDFTEFLWAMGMPQTIIDHVRTKIASCEAIDETIFRSFSELHRQFIATGGMPEAVKNYVDTNVFTYLNGIFSKIIDGYRNDILRYCDNDLKSKVISCFNAIPSMLAYEKRFIFSKIGEYGDTGSGVAKGLDYYAPALDWLSMACVTRTCYNLTEPHRPLEERRRLNNFKIYMLDTGLLSSFYDQSLTADIVLNNEDSNNGPLIENAVASAMSIGGKSLMFFSKDDPRLEVDFISVLNGRVCAVEVKSGSNRRCHSLNRVMSDYGTDGIMFETRNCFIDEKGVRHYPLFAASFLDSLETPIDIRPNPRGDVDAAIKAFETLHRDDNR